MTFTQNSKPNKNLKKNLGHFDIAIKKDTYTSVFSKNDQLNFGLACPVLNWLVPGFTGVPPDAQEEKQGSGGEAKRDERALPLPQHQQGAPRPTRQAAHRRGRLPGMYPQHSRVHPSRVHPRHSSSPITTVYRVTQNNDNNILLT